MHNNLEVLFDSDFYFREYNNFDDTASNGVSRGVDRIVAQIFDEFDLDKDGQLNRDEAKAMMQAKLGDK